MMRVLTVRQPWAWAIIHGGKDVENRVRNIAGDYRGPVAIHAGLAYDEDAVVWWGDRPFAVDECGDHDGPRGAIIGVVDLADVHSASFCWERDVRRVAELYRTRPDEFARLADDGAGGVIGRTRLCSPWAMSDHQHLELANPRALIKPIPYKGALGLRSLSPEVEAQIRAKLA